MSASPEIVIGPGGRAPRHSLGLPAGSVRALLAIMVLGLIWSLVLLPTEWDIKVPVYLYYLMFLVLGHFFAAHGHTIRGPTTGTHSPLYLPRGTIRFFIVAGFIGVLGFRYYKDRSFDALAHFEQPLLEQPYLPLVMAGAFFLGVASSRVVGRMTRNSQTPPYWFHDIEAWVALLATLGLVVEFIIQLVINPSLEPKNRLQMPQWQSFLAAITSYYFGARS